MTGYEESENIVVGVSTDLKKPLDEYESLMLALPADGHGGRAGGNGGRAGDSPFDKSGGVCFVKVSDSTVWTGHSFARF